MEASLPERAPIEALPSYQPAIRRVEQLLSHAAMRQETYPQLRSANGEVIDLPEPLFQILRQVVHILAQGDSVSIVPIHRELTTQQAADILNVSRPYLISLLDQNLIPFNRTGKHRRIKFGDLMSYKRKRDTERRAQLAELTRISEEYDLYS
jgi:excisionase family DNA binding protein